MKISIEQKIRRGAALLVVFLLVLATNMMDNNHFKIVQKSLNTVYEDRLLAKDYIYKITRQLQVKKNLIRHLEIEELSALNRYANDSIQVLITSYGSTQLTENEAVRFKSLKRNLNELISHESKQMNDVLSEDLSLFQVTENYFSAVYEDLDALSEIQLEEGKREIDNSNRTINTSNLISRLEIGFLIVIGLLIQMLIFIKPLK